MNQRKRTVMLLLSLQLTSAVLASDIDLSAIEKSYSDQLSQQKPDQVKQIEPSTSTNNVSSVNNSGNNVASVNNVAYVNNQTPPVNNQPAGLITQPALVNNQLTTTGNQPASGNQQGDAQPLKPKTFINSISSAAGSAARGVQSAVAPVGNGAKVFAGEVLTDLKPLLKESAKMVLVGEDNYRRLYGNPYNRYRYAGYNYQGYNPAIRPGYNTGYNVASNRGYRTANNQGYNAGYSTANNAGYNTANSQVYGATSNQGFTQPMAYNTVGYAQPVVNAYSANAFNTYSAPALSTSASAVPVFDHQNVPSSCTVSGFTQQPPPNTPKPATSNPFTMLYQMIFGTGDSAGTSVNVKAAQDNATSVNLSSNNPIIQQKQPQPVQTECQPNSSALLMTTPSAVVAKNLYERKGPFSFPVVLSEPLPLPLPKDSLYGRTPIID